MIIKNKEDEFYSLFIESAKLMTQCAKVFNDLVHNYEDVEQKVALLKKMETDCDIQTHKIIKTLHDSFLTPFDREDIYSIAREMDDIVDCMEEAASRFCIFEIKRVNTYVIQMSDLILNGMQELELLFCNLSQMKKKNIIKEKVISVNRIENECDAIFRKALNVLFKTEKDPIELIKWKELFELLEASMDVCERVANTAEGMVMKYA